MYFDEELKDVIKCFVDYYERKNNTTTPIS